MRLMTLAVFASLLVTSGCLGGADASDDRLRTSQGDDPTHEVIEYFLYEPPMASLDPPPVAEPSATPMAWLDGTRIEPASQAGFIETIPVVWSVEIEQEVLVEAVEVRLSVDVTQTTIQPKRPGGVVNVNPCTWVVDVRIDGNPLAADPAYPQGCVLFSNPVIAQGVYPVVAAWNLDEAATIEPGRTLTVSLRSVAASASTDVPWMYALSGASGVDAVVKLGVPPAA